MSDDVEYEMSIDNPTLPKGAEIQIPGLGVFENGHSYKVSKEEADNYRTYHTRQEDVVDEESGAVVGAQPVPGPTLLQASKGMYGVEVSTPSNSKPAATPNRNNAPTASQQPAKAPQVEAEKAVEQAGGEQ